MFPIKHYHQQSKSIKKQISMPMLTVNDYIDKPARPCQDGTIYRKEINMSRPHSSTYASTSGQYGGHHLFIYSCGNTVNFFLRLQSIGIIGLDTRIVSYFSFWQIDVCYHVLFLNWFNNTGVISSVGHFFFYPSYCKQALETKNRLGFSYISTQKIYLKS